MRAIEKLSAKSKPIPVPYHCDNHADKDIEFCCSEHESMMCALCAWEHSDHRQHVVPYTRDSVEADLTHFRNIINNFANECQDLQAALASSESVSKSGLYTNLSSARKFVEKHGEASACDTVILPTYGILQLSMKLDSVIAKCNCHKLTLEGIVGLGRKLDLIFRASRDGGSGAAFHAACDNKGSTLTLVSAKGKIFGGYISSSWKSAGGQTIFLKYIMGELHLKKPDFYGTDFDIFLSLFASVYKTKSSSICASEFCPKMKQKKPINQIVLRASEITDYFIVSSMGKQSTGKSYTLNHLTGSSFNIAGTRCTDACWMSVKVDDDCLYVILDFEGLSSFERTDQDDMLLSLFNSALLSMTIFKTEHRLDRDVDQMFTKFNLGKARFTKQSQVARSFLGITLARPLRKKEQMSDWERWTD